MLHLALKAFAPAPRAVRAAARRHRAQLPRGPRVPRPHGRASTGCGSTSPPCRTTSTRRAARAPRRHPQPAADRAAARRDPGEQVRRGVRRRPPRRGEGPRQGAGVLAARRVRPVGPAPPAPRAVAPLQRPARARRARPRLPAVQLDRAGRLAVHRARGHRAAGDLLRPRARGVPARRHVADAGDWGGPKDGESGREPAGPLPHRRRHVLHRRRRLRRDRRWTRSSPRSRASRLTERGATRADDRMSEAAMEDRKREGYF